MTPRERRSRILRGDQPTAPMPMLDMIRRTPYRNARIPEVAADEPALLLALDLAVRVGELMLRCGAGAPQVEGSVAAVAAAAGVDRVELDITLQSLLVQATSADGRPHTLLRVVRRTRHDYDRLVAVHRLVESLVARELTPEQAATRLREIERQPRIFADGAVAVASALLASAVAVMIGATAAAAVVTVVVVLAVTGIVRLHRRMDLPEFYGNAINAFAATVFAGAFFALGAAGLLPLGENDFAFVVAGGIVAMLPGRTMASAIEDVLFGYPLTGAGRLLSVLLSLTGLIIGIGLGLRALIGVTGLLGASFVSPAVLELRVSQAAIGAALGGALVVGLAAAVTIQSRPRLILPTGLLSVFGATIGAGLVRIVDVGAVTASGVAAVGIGLLGRLAAQRMRIPSMVIVVPATFALLPGLTIFRGLYELVASGTDQGLLTTQSGITTLLGAGAVLLAIATGTVFGEILASPLDRRTRGGERPDDPDGPARPRGERAG